MIDRLTKIIMERGMRNPKDPFKTLPPSNSFVKLTIKKRILEREDDIATNDKKFDKLLKIENKLKIMMEKL